MVEAWWEKSCRAVVQTPMKRRGWLMRIAFYVIYPNEFVHFEPLRKHLPEAEYVVVRSWPA
jgi:hypothetical protein